MPAKICNMSHKINYRSEFRAKKKVRAINARKIEEYEEAVQYKFQYSTKLRRISSSHTRTFLHPSISIFASYDPSLAYGN